MDNTKMTNTLIALALCVSPCTAWTASCEWYPTRKFIDVAMKCSGTMVSRPPSMLPSSLKMLLMNGTAIASLDHTTFQGRDLRELTTLSVTDGDLAIVGANAFCSLPALRKIDLSHNQLVMMHNLSLSCNKALSSVSLANNPSLPHVPRLVSSSVETLYLDYCGLKSVDVSTFEGMPALKTISLIGNTDLNCSSVKRHFKKLWPEVLLMCDDSSIAPPYPLSPGDQERTPQNTISITDDTDAITINAASSVSKSVSFIVLGLVTIAIFISCLWKLLSGRIE